MAIININKNGYPLAVVLSMDESCLFEKLKEKMWLEQAQQAEKEGFIGEKESEDLLQGFLNAQA